MFTQRSAYVLWVEYIAALAYRLHIQNSTFLYVRNGAKCAITGTKIKAVLQAAHLHPYASGGADVVGNIIILCADLHTLMDDHHWAINPATLKVEMTEDMAGCLRYNSISNRKLIGRLPNRNMLQLRYSEFVTVNNKKGRVIVK